MKRASFQKEWMPEGLWRQVKRFMPVPCVDIILQNSRGEILLGWRKILPYRNVWAFPGGRVYRGESLRFAADRILSEYGLSAGNLFLVGVFPVKFPTRADLSVCLASNKPIGQVFPDGHEFSSFKWTKQVPSRTGANYVRMILKWRLLRQDPRALQYAAVR
jgi:ADP-ribose pyrophosphatase YjhB (NUDIX family)